MLQTPFSIAPMSMRPGTTWTTMTALMKKTKALDIKVLFLTQLDNAFEITDLMLPPSNRLEVLSGDRAGYWSIRINDQWRVCFSFTNGEASNVEITDYH